MIFENNTEDAVERRSRINAERRSQNMAYSGLGKLPPQAIDLEECVIGAIMLEKEAMFQVSDFLKAEQFYKDSHQKIFNAITKLSADNDPIDIVTVTQTLRKLGELETIGGAFYITQLTERVSSAANIEFHARIVYQKFLQREVIRVGTEMVQVGYEDTTDVLELLEQTQLNLMKLTNFNTSQQTSHIGEMITAGLIELEKPATNGLTGVGTGFVHVNNFTAGWQKGELTILAARPAMGKSALSVQFARNAAVLYNEPTAIFSLEMTKQQITRRMIANETEIFLEKINKKTLTDYDKQSLDGKLYLLRNSPLHVDDTPALTTVAFRTKCIRLKKLYDIQIIFVDYLQLMRGVTAEGKNKGNREQEIGEITRCLKAVAKDLDVPVIALSQLSRAVESRPGAAKRPMLQDLRESGNIEQDADNVLFLFRPEYYGLSEIDGMPTQSLAELIWAKHRMGEIGSLYLKFRGAVMRFENWTNPNAPQIDVQFEPNSQKEETFIIQPNTLFDDSEAPF